MSAIVDFLTQTRDTFQAAIDDSRFKAILAEIADMVTASLRGGGKLLTIGNGGSAGDGLRPTIAWYREAYRDGAHHAGA
ncbi:hypothetical protein [Bradyrhizobium sp. P5_C11_2]